MNKLIRASIFEEDLTPSSEAITPQLNDKDINRINEIIGEMREDYKQTNLSGLKQYLKEMSQILTARFGIPVKVENDPYRMGPWTCTFSLIDEYTGFDTASDLLKDGLSTILDGDFKNRFHDASKKFKQHIFQYDIVVDLNKVYVTGLPNDYDCFISVTWTDLFESNSEFYVSDDRMITAILLHEMGHVFSKLEYLSRTRRSFLAIEDALQDVINKKTNSTYKFAISYRKNINPGFNSEEFKDSNMMTLAIGILKDIKDRYSYELSNRHSTTLESVADQFAARFGYGEEIVQYLSKVMPLDMIKHVELPSKFYIFTTSYFVILLLLGSIFVGFGVLFFIGVISFLVVSFFLFLEITNTTPKELVYDIPYIRFEKIALDYIRQIRIYSDKLSQEDRKRMIKGIDNIKEILAKMKKFGASTQTLKCEKLFEFLNSNLKTAREISDFNENLERLMENPFHVDQYRF